MKLKVRTVGRGLHPSEVVVDLQTATGASERLVVSQRSLKDSALEIGYPISVDDQKLLVELPRETQSGSWRVWVPRHMVSEA